MDKYQEALERARICGDRDCSDCKFNEICANDKKGWYGTLKELVDKATPKKVLKYSYRFDAADVLIVMLQFIGV